MQHQAEDLFHTGLDDVAQLLAVELRRFLFTKRPDGEVLFRRHLALQGVAVLQLHFLGLRDRQTQPVGDIRSNMVAAHRQHIGVPHVAINIDGNIGRPAADIADRHAHLALRFGQRGLASRQRVEHKLRDIHPGRPHALAQVLH